MKELIVWIPALILTEVVGLPTSLTSLILYTEQKNWNEARFICESMGGHLLYIKDSAKKELVKAFEGVEPWDSAISHSASYHIGLYNIQESNPGVYSWLDCDALGSWDDWKFLEPILDADLKCTRKSSSGWGSVDCDDNKMYVCETVGGTCVYESVQDSKGVDSAPYDAGPLSVSQCQAICDTALNNGYECWAFTWSATKCDLHFTDSAYFEDSANVETSTGEHIYKKKCIVAQVANDLFPLMNFASPKPLSTCPGSVGTGQATVYALFNHNVTWDEARTICENNNQQLLVMYSAQESLKIQELYGANSGTFWLGLNGSDSLGNAYWVDGTLSTWGEFLPGHPPVGAGVTWCAADTPSSNTWTSHYCGDHRPFVCQKTGGKCMYMTLERTKGLNGQDQGPKARHQCESDCQGQTDCVGYSYYYFGLTLKCHLHLSNDPEYLFNQVNLETDIDRWTVYRYTCTIGMTFDEVPLLPEAIQGVNVADLIASSSVTTEASSVQSIAETSSVLEESSTVQEWSSAQMTTDVDETGQISSSEEVLATSVEEIGPTSPAEYLTVTEVESSDLSSIEYFSTIVSSIEATSITSSYQSTFSNTNEKGTTQLQSEFYSYSDHVTSVHEASSDYVSSEVLATGSSGVVSSSTTISVVSASSALELPTAAIASSVVQELSSAPTSTPPPSTTTTVSYLSSTTSVTKSTPKPSTLLTICPCKCLLPTTLNETEKLIQQIKDNLLLEKSLLAKEIRRKISAGDDRTSSQSMGYVAVTFLSFVLVVTLMADATLLISHLRMLMWNMFR